MTGLTENRLARTLAGGDAPGVELSDRELALALLASAPGAPRVAWARFSPLARRVLRRFFGPRFEVEDLVQEVFLSLFRKLPTLREPGALRAFVIAIVVRTAQHHRRHVRSRPWLTLAEPLAAHGPRAAVDVPARYALLRLYGMLSRLPERDRTAFVLRFVEGMQTEEIAAAVGASVPTVRRRFTRAWSRVSFLAAHDPFLIEYLGRPRFRPASANAALTRPLQLSLET